MKKIEFKDSEITDCRFWGSILGVGPNVDDPIVGDITWNDDGTVTYILKDYGIIRPNGWNDFYASMDTRYRNKSYLPNWLLKLFEKTREAK